MRGGVPGLCKLDICTRLVALLKCGAGLSGGVSAGGAGDICGVDNGARNVPDVSLGCCTPLGVATAAELDLNAFAACKRVET